MIDPKIILRKGNCIKIVKPRLDKNGRFISYGLRQSGIFFDESFPNENEAKMKEDGD